MLNFIPWLNSIPLQGSVPTPWKGKGSVPAVRQSAGQVTPLRPPRLLALAQAFAALAPLTLLWLANSACIEACPPPPDVGTPDAPTPGVVSPGVDPEGEPGVVIGDFSLGDPMQFRGTSQGLEVSEVQTAGKFVLFCNGIGGLRIQDASNPEALAPVAQLNSALSHPRFPRCQHTAATMLEDDLRFVAFTNRGDELQPVSFVSVFEMTGAPREVDVFDATESSVPASFEGVAMKDQWLFIAAHSVGVFVVERTPSALVERLLITGFENAYGVTLEGDRLYVADGIGGLKVVDISDPTAASIVGELVTDGAALHVEVDANRDLAYLSSGASGVHVIDISGEPSLVTTLETPGSALATARTVDRLFVGDWNEVRIFDVSDTSGIFELGKERPQVNAPFPRILGIASAGENIFVGEWSALFTYSSVLDVAAPDLQMSSRDVVFENVEVGDTGSTAVLIKNGGLFPLNLQDITTAEPFSVAESSLEIAPGETGLLEILFSPLSVGVKQGSILICSDDIDENKREVNVFGNPPGLRLGDEAPLTQLELLGGGQLDVADLEGNVVLLAYFATF